MIQSLDLSSRTHENEQFSKKIKIKKKNTRILKIQASDSTNLYICERGRKCAEYCVKKFKLFHSLYFFCERGKKPKETLKKNGKMGTEMCQIYNI